MTEDENRQKTKKDISNYYRIKSKEKKKIKAEKKNKKQKQKKIATAA